MRKNSSQLIIEVENREVEFVQNDYKIVGSIGECLLNKPYWRSIVEKNLFCTLIELLKLAIFHSYMSYKC